MSLWNMKICIFLDDISTLNPWDTFGIKIFLSGYEQLNVLREIDLRKVKAPKPKLMPEPASDVFNIVFYCASLS